MATLFCRLCFEKTNEYFTIDSDFRDKILKHLNIHVAENVLLCTSCTRSLESFDQYYEQIHKAQQQSQQKDEIRYIILLKNDKPDEIEFKEIESTTSEGVAQHFTLIDIPEGFSNEDALPQESLGNVIEQTLNAVTEFIPDEAPKQIPLTAQQTPTVSSKKLKILDGFPKNLIQDGKLLVKGKELSKLIAKFYRLECSLCPVLKKFRKFSAMLNHYKSQHSTKGFVTCCGSKILKLRQIAMHMCRHIQPEAFTCSLCNKILTCPKILQYHVQNHLPENQRSLACPEPGCNRRFSYQSALVTHSISHLPEEERSAFTCCGRSFSTSGRMKAHVNTVHSEKGTLKKEFSCEKCSKSFLCKSNLSYHLTTHKDFEFQVQCAVCNKWLKNKICLRKHMAIHSEVRHFCDLCEYSAINKQCLINHKKIQHSDSKPFNCEFCSKAFKLKNTLTNHVNAQHNISRKYICEFCSRTFVSSGNYYSHRKRMHPNELKSKIREKEISDNKKRMEVMNSKLSQK